MVDCNLCYYNRNLKKKKFLGMLRISSFRFLAWHAGIFQNFWQFKKILNYQCLTRLGTKVFFGNSKRRNQAMYHLLFSVALCHRRRRCASFRASPYALQLLSSLYSQVGTLLCTLIFSLAFTAESSCVVAAIFDFSKNCFGTQDISHCPYS